MRKEAGVKDQIESGNKFLIKDRLGNFSLMSAVVFLDGESCSASETCLCHTSVQHKSKNKRDRRFNRTKKSNIVFFLVIKMTAQIKSNGRIRDT